MILRNNLNGNFSQVENISQVKPGAFANINWNKRELMLPLSPRKGFLSFSDKKWDWRYNIDKEGVINEKEPILFELLTSGQYVEHKCKEKNIS